MHASNLDLDTPYLFSTWVQHPVEVAADGKERPLRQALNET